MSIFDCNSWCKPFLCLHLEQMNYFGAFLYSLFGNIIFYAFQPLNTSSKRFLRQFLVHRLRRTDCNDFSKKPPSHKRRMKRLKLEFSDWVDMNKQ